MTYTPQTWTNDVSPLNADRMNHIETGISDAHTDIAANQVTATESVVAANESTSSDTFGDLATNGPVISSISNGRYLVHFGCTIAGAADTDGAASLSYNGGAPVLGDGVIGGTPNVGGEVVSYSVSRTAVHDFTEGGSNSVELQYRRYTGSGSVTFWNRWIVIVRIGDVP